MCARAVIGASYGDEGKGRTVDWLAAPHGPAALVVRSNGGAQAAHTVSRPNGDRHVFHHLGAGSFSGARTHLSRFMVSHPLVHADEVAVLRSLGVEPDVTADPRGFVTTPWDMMVNQAVELARGGARHGSCGLGFGETVGRCEASGFPLCVRDLSSAGLGDKLKAIRADWLPERMAHHQLAPDTGPLEFAMSDDLLDRFMDQCEAFAQQVQLRGDSDIGTERDVIFEGAQGLLLDQNGPGFPYLTRSNTGLANIAAIAAEAGMAQIEPIYITRCYLTRHGRGPMESEQAIDRWYAVEDPTNRPNPWQESLRFGLLDLDGLASRIRADVAHSDIAAAPGLALTCLDQSRGTFAWIEGGWLTEGPWPALEEAIARITRMPIRAAFSSPCNEPARADNHGPVGLIPFRA